MKKNYVLLAALLIFSIAGFSQERSKKIDEAEMFPKAAEYKASQKISVTGLKVFGDTMAYFDFADSIPTGWIADNNSNNNFDWKWADRAPGGQFSTNIPAISSTTGSNGFMLLESDSFNTPIPTAGAVPMDAFFESNAIDIDSVGSVLVRFQQSFRFCCRTSNRLELQVRASDDPNWTIYDAKGGASVNNSTANPMVHEINVSAAAANSDSIYIRFYNGESTHYYWMIDDIAIVEGPANDLIQESFITQYDAFNSDQWQFYEQVPSALAVPMFVQTNVFNNGSSNETNVDVQYEVTQDEDCFGNAGAGAVALESMSAGNIASFGRDTSLFVNPFMPPAKGVYTITASVSSAASDQDPSNNSISETFIISDTVYAKDDGTAEASDGPGSYVGFNENEAKMVLYYDVPTDQFLTSMSYYITANSFDAVGTQFTALVYGFDRNAPGCNYNAACFTTNPVVSNPLAVTIDSSMLGTWVTVPLFSPFLLTAGGYAVGFEQNNVNTDMQVVVGTDLTADGQAPYDQRFLYDVNTFIWGKTENRWIAPGFTPMMRMNFGLMNDDCYLVGAEEPQTNTAFDVAPNPNNGVFSFGISSKVPMNYTLRITNMLGQNVYNEEISVSNNYLNKQMDLSHLDQGIYFATLENGFERHTKKIIIK